MTLWAALPVVAFAGGMGRRLAGGVINDWTGHAEPGGDWPIRAAEGLIFVGIAAAGGFVWMWAALIGVAVTLGAGLGSPTVTPDPYAVGLFNYIIPGIVIGVGADHHVGCVIVLAAGAAAGLIVRVLRGRTAPWLPRGFQGDTNLMEFAWGATMGLAVFFAGAITL